MMVAILSVTIRGTIFFLQDEELTLSFMSDRVPSLTSTSSILSPSFGTPSATNRDYVKLTWLTKKINVLKKISSKDIL